MMEEVEMTGPSCYYNGVMPGIVTRDPELMKRVFINDFQYFTGRHAMTAVSNNLPVNAVRFSRVSGDDWRLIKNIVLPAFKTSNIKKAFAIAHECAEECLRVLDSKATGTNGCVEVFEPFCNMASDFCLQFFTGARTDVQNGNEAALALTKASRRSVGQFGATIFVLLDLIPNIPWLHKIFFSVRNFFNQLPSDETIDRMLPIINHRRANPEVSLRIASIRGVPFKPSGGLSLSATLMSYPPELITCSNTCIFLTAGVDSAASPLAFTSYLLAEHQEIQDKVRAEIQALLDKEGRLTYDNLGYLTYLGQVLSESLRMYPSLPGSIRRTCDGDYEYNGIRILKGMNVYVPTLDLHHDPTLWPEPTKFDPERFNKTNKESIHPMSYFPFGLGPRKCIASALSQMEITVTLALLVARYKLLPSGKYKDPSVRTQLFQNPRCVTLNYNADVERFGLYRWRKKTFSLFKELGIPGPEPSLIFGNLIPIWREGLGPAASRWVKEYGDIVGYYNGMMPGIITRDLELMKRVFINDFQYFTGRQTIAAVSNNISVNEVRLTRVAGDDWRHLKNIVLPAFKTSNIRKAFPLVYECAEECLRALDSKMAGSVGCVELFEPFCNMASDLGLQVFAGARTNIQRGDAAALALSKAARRSVGQFGAVTFLLLNLLPNIPRMHKILFSLRNLFIQLPSDELMDRMLPIINHRRAHPEATTGYSSYRLEKGIVTYPSPYVFGTASLSRSRASVELLCLPHDATEDTSFFPGRDPTWLPAGFD
ncbi:hypothetical protein HPB50_022418 [Hyalomma asiaticum]|uniref:Uncharacterized protein n=1 Tax=Hyalomma asiaticum TaxID=266040 RepID=A0ACB7T994_HYAAI|nr:hypothetical protein HPB50_022418 [Hyalomma asiaticum]